ncbi:MAG: hypothetical protein V1888_01230 [archaeon]
MGDIAGYVNIVSKMLYERDDKFPDEITHSRTDLKCTNGWLTGVMGSYAVGKVLNVLGHDTNRFYEEVSNIIAKEDDKNRDTTKEDVQLGNKLLEMILKDCGVEKLKRGNL